MRYLGKKKFNKFFLFLATLSFPDINLTATPLKSLKTFLMICFWMLDFWGAYKSTLIAALPFLLRGAAIEECRNRKGHFSSIAALLLRHSYCDAPQ